MAEKISYEPVETKRFHVNDDEFSRERIKYLTKSHGQITQELGDTSIGFAGWGSLIKGKKLETPEAARASDVDLGIFFDVQKWREKINEYTENSKILVEIIKEHLAEVQHEHIEETCEERRHYRKFVTETFERICGSDYFSVSPEQQQARFIKAIKRGDFVETHEGVSEDRHLGSIVQKFTKAMFVNYSPDILPDTRRQPHKIGFPKELPKGIESFNIKAYDYESFKRYLMGAFVAAKGEVKFMAAAKFFSIDIGGGLREMRKDFFQHLSREQDREKLWQQIRFVILRQEREGYVPPGLDRHFPIQFKDAYKSYTGRALIEVESLVLIPSASSTVASSSTTRTAHSKSNPRANQK